MNVKNCRNCGKIFNYGIGPVICPSCKDSLEAKFQEAKKYVQDNRGAGINEVAEAVDVDPQQIRQWVREERLEFSDDSMIGIACEKCGTTIKSGRFCEKCKAEMVGSFRNAMGTGASSQPSRSQTPEKSGGPRMRFL